MTREDEAKSYLDVMGYTEVAKERVHYDAVVTLMLAFADAEAAAMRERADKVFIEDIVEQSKRMGTRPRDYQSPGQWMEATRRAAIRALPATGEVGRG